MNPGADRYLCLAEPFGGRSGNLQITCSLKSVGECDGAEQEFAVHRAEEEPLPAASPDHRAHGE